MAKTKKRVVKKRARKHSKSLSGLGFTPEEHKKRNEEYELDARRFLREVSEEADAGRCDLAFSRLIDGVSYAGMAEAEAHGSGRDSGAIGSLASSAIKYFRKTCRIG